MTANHEYWNINPAPGTQGPPLVEEITYRIIPQSQTAVAALKAGEIDGILGVGLEDSKEFEKTENIKNYYSKGSRPRFFMMDWRTEKLSNGNPNPFLDIRVRKAMNHALDIDTIIKHYTSGREKKTTLVVEGSS